MQTTGHYYEQCLYAKLGYKNKLVKDSEFRIGMGSQVIRFKLAAQFSRIIVSLIFRSAMHAFKYSEVFWISDRDDKKPLVVVAIAT